MKSASSLWIAAGLAVAAGCASSRAPVVRATAPRLALGAEIAQAAQPLRSVADETVRLQDVRGAKGTLVVFTCNHCPWSKAWEGRISEIGNQYAKRGVGVIAINPNSPTAYPEDGFVEMQERAAEAGFEFPYAVDAGGVVARAFGATKTPEIFLFDGAGKLVYVGAVDDNANDPDSVSQPYLRNALDALLSGSAVPVAETRSLGCSIGYEG